MVIIFSKVVTREREELIFSHDPLGAGRVQKLDMLYAGIENYPKTLFPIAFGKKVGIHNSPI